MRLDATVVLVPSAVTTSSPAVAIGEGLPEAVRSINEGADVLARLAAHNGRRKRFDRV